MVDSSHGSLLKLHIYIYIYIYRLCVPHTHKNTDKHIERERVMEMMRHFSHKHPLIPKDDVPKANQEEDIFCNGCEEPISESEPAYGCEECFDFEDFFLHKACAQLPREIIHPKHPNHSLILLPRSPYSRGFECNECGAVCEGFAYHCSICEYDLDITCAVKDNDTLGNFENRWIKRECHEHTLIFQPRPASFRCDACGVKDEDLFYLCPSCPFFVHQSCVTLSRTAKRQDHDHDLSLAYSFPPDYEHYLLYCDICWQRIYRQYWIYYCGPCRYFVHLKCMATETHNSDDDLLDDAKFEQKLLRILIDDELFCLPTADMSAKLIERFLLRKDRLVHIESEIQHWSHEQQPLILIDERQNENVEDNIQEDEERICDGCIEPISSTPYYSCSESGYFLHLPCANIPSKLQHPSHPHPLKRLRYVKFYSTFRCNICGCDSNGFLFKCVTCNDFFLDLKCAALPRIIQHENHHNHPLFQFDASNETCSACNRTIDGLAFGCETCNFYLEYRCAILPKSIRHRWDEHPLVLRYPPFSDHPDDFCCDMCGKEMHPMLWHYHCSHCDNSFHPLCVPRLGRLPGMKFGGKIEVSSHHPHPLEYKRKATLKSSCYACGANIDSDIFECEDCTYCLCRKCAT